MKNINNFESNLKIECIKVVLSTILNSTENIRCHLRSSMLKTTEQCYYVLLSPSRLKRNTYKSRITCIFYLSIWFQYIVKKSYCLRCFKNILPLFILRLFEIFCFPFSYYMIPYTFCDITSCKQYRVETHKAYFLLPK